MRLFLFYFFLDEAFSHFAVYQNTGCSVWFQFSFNCRVSVQASCGLWGWYPVSGWVNWAWKECLCHADEETPFPTLSCYFHPRSRMKGRTMAPSKEEQVTFQDVGFKPATALIWPCLTSVTQVVGTFVRSTAGGVWLKNPDINVCLSVFVFFFFWCSVYSQ